jgi:hypothetical protein
VVRNDGFVFNHHDVESPFSHRDKIGDFHEGNHFLRFVPFSADGLF